MKESEIEKILVDETKKLGGRAFKWVSPGNDGVPDRIVVFPDTTPIFVELKTITGNLSLIQRVQVKRLIDLGQWVEIVKGISGLVMFFQELGYPETASRIREKYSEEVQHEIQTA